MLVAINPCMYFKEQDKGIFLEWKLEPGTDTGVWRRVEKGWE